jgi:hypothetical protein
MAISADLGDEDLLNIVQIIAQNVNIHLRLSQLRALVSTSFSSKVLPMV